MGAKSTRKSRKEELALERMLQEHGFAATRIPHQGGRRLEDGDDGGDILWPILGIDRRMESKVRGNGWGFKNLYEWLGNNDLLTVRMDHQKNLAILPLDFLIEIAATAEKYRALVAKEMAAPTAQASPEEPAETVSDHQAEAVFAETLGAL